MAYRFALAAVLRVRELAAEGEEQTLARILAEIASLRRALEKTEAELLETAQVRQQAFASAALPAMHLHASYNTAHALRVRCGLLRKQLASFEELRTQQVVRYEDAYRRREVLVSLRDKAQDAWVYAQNKREQGAADEAFLARRSHETRPSDEK